MSGPKYSLPEIERRWLVNESLVPALDKASYIDVEDRYLENSRLRLRKMCRSDGSVLYKLCKKYGKTGAITEPITNIYLTKDEYELLLSLPGRDLMKRRYLLTEQGRTISVSRMRNPDTGAVILLAETEFSSVEEAIGFQPPAYCSKDVTSDPVYESSSWAR